MLEALCDVVAWGERWERAPDVLAQARAWTDEARLIALRFYADRLDGRAALASGDTARAAEMLTRARNGFASLGARWEEAVTGLFLGEATGDRDQIERSLDVFDELGSIREIERARRLLA